MKKTFQAHDVSPAKDNKSSGSEALGPRYAMIGTVVVAFLGLVGTLITQCSNRENTLISISATQTAEARVASVPSPTKPALTPTIAPTLSPSPSPSTIVAGAGPCPEDMVLVRQGTFWMGAAPGDPDAQEDEKPGKRIELDAFCIDRTEVSNQEYAKFVRTTSHRPPPQAPGPDLNTWVGGNPPADSSANLPVVRVSWTDADAYCRWRGRALPTEAQWEKAARGSDARLYPWGDKWDPTLANWAGTGANTAKPVDAYPGGRTEYGALNMAGNVSEWVADWYQSDWYAFMPAKNPTGPSVAAHRVVRGASFMDANTLLRASARQSYAPEPPVLSIMNFISIRCAKEAKP